MPIRIPRNAALLIALALPQCSATQAAPVVELWQHNGVQVSTAPAVPDYATVARDGQGGCLLQWRDFRSSGLTDEDAYAGHVLAAGAPDPRWPASGVLIAGGLNSETPADAAADGSGGAYFLYGLQDLRPPFLTDIGLALYLRRLDAGGADAVGWSPSTVTIRPNGTYGGVLVPLWPDGHGGVMAVFTHNRTFVSSPPYEEDGEITVQRILPNGSVAPGWPDTGIAVCRAPGQRRLPKAVTDGQGGAFVAWADFRAWPGASVYATRVEPSGHVVPGWAEDGTVMAAAAYPQDLWSIAADGQGGLFVGVQDYRNSPRNDILVYHLRGDGTSDPAWPAGGVVVGDGMKCVMAGDGAGGVILVWENYHTFGGVFGSHLTATGALAPGWVADGRLISDAPNGSDAFDPQIIADDEGGAFVVWLQGSTNQCWVHHFTSGGSPAVGWPEGGQPVVDAGTGGVPVSLSSDGLGGALVAWLDGRLVVNVNLGGYQIFAQRYGATGIVAADLSLVRASAEPGSAHLKWYSSQPPGTELSIERRQATSEWQAVATRTIPSDGTIEYVDASVESGSRYGYRLALAGTPPRYSVETWLDIPAAYRFALAGARPNPASGGELSVEYTLPRRGPATLELFDLAGRRLLAHDAGSEAAGEHVTRLGAGPGLQPGVYWLRLTQGSNAATARAVVVN